MKQVLKYAKYLKAQRDRRRKESATARLERRRQQARPFVQAAVRAAVRTAQADRDEAVQRKNALLRKHKGTEQYCQSLLAHNCALENRLVKAERRLAESKVVAQENDRLQQQLLKKNNKLERWELWYSRVLERAGAGFLKKLWHFGRRRPPAPDACWGGGQ